MADVTLKILEIGEPREFDSKYGKFFAYPVKASIDGVEFEEPVEINYKPPNLPQVGDSLVGTLNQTEYGWKFKKARAPSQARVAPASQIALPVSDNLRAIALQEANKAIASFNAVAATPVSDAEDVVRVAVAYYEFLKGINK